MTSFCVAFRCSLEAFVKQREDWHLTDTLEYEHGRGDPFAAAVRATRMPMVVTDPAQPDNPIVFCNVAFQTLTGYERAEIIGRNCRFLQGPDTDTATIERVRAAIRVGHDVDVDLLNTARMALRSGMRSTCRRYATRMAFCASSLRRRWT